MKLVKQIKQFDDIRVANAMGFFGYKAKNPKRRTRDVEKLVGHLPRWVLVKILERLIQYENY